MDALNKQPLDYYLLPRLDMSLPRLRLAQDNGVSLDSYRFDTLDALYELQGVSICWRWPDEKGSATRDRLN